ncbi:hypothetical protein OS493_030404 [Desmophyllum pertusum]|uniref:Uncharacterized protein n=1 Tax=Desmophyllum pertusum TaxID=174260 RepID=A0A9X0CXL9_9CNID|nr:hypothetical protein OS493_030404 [Desmophyllum pertusum]
MNQDKGLSSEESDNEDLMKSPFDSSSPSDTLINSRVADAVKDDPVSITSKEAKSSERSAEESEQANEGSSLGRTPSEEDVSEHSTDGLIGTSDERKELMDHINAEYEASLAVDKEKELQKEANVRREALRVSRENRVLHEPAAQKPRVIVSVFFILRKIQSVASLMLCMTQCELPMPLCKDGEDDVTFFDAQYDNNHDDTLPDQEVERKLSIPQNGGDHEVNFVSVQNENVYNESLPDEELKLEHEPQDLDEVQPRPPVQLLEDDPEISSVEQVTIQTLEVLNVKREMAAKAQLINHSVMVREAKMQLAMVFVEKYTVFWDNFVSSYCEGCSHFTFSVSAALSQDDFVAIGRLLSHQYIQTGTLPLQISEAIMQQAVVGKVSEDCLINSFLMLLHEKEREILQHAIHGNQPFPVSDVLDILSDYGVTSIPSASNIGKILLQVSETELISKPFLYITKLREGMGPFWQDVTDKEVHALYSVCTPTPSNVLQSLEVSAEDQQEAKDGSHVLSRAKTTSYLVGSFAFALELMCCFLTAELESSL